MCFLIMHIVSKFQIFIQIITIEKLKKISFQLFDSLSITLVNVFFFKEN